MMEKRNKFLLILITFLSIIGIFWNIYSYLCIGIIHQYDIAGIHLDPTSIETLNAMWKSFLVFILINSFLLLLGLLQMLFLRHINIRLWFYAISLMVSAVSILFWENNYRKLLVEITEGCDIMINILRPGYYTYYIGIIIITILLLLLEKCRTRQETYVG